MEAALAAPVGILLWGPLLVALVVAAGSGLLVFLHRRAAGRGRHPGPEPPSAAPPNPEGPEAPGHAPPQPGGEAPAAPVAGAPFLVRVWKNQGFFSASLRALASRPLAADRRGTPQRPEERRSFLRFSPPPGMVKTCRVWFCPDEAVSDPEFSGALSPVAGHEAELLNLSAGGLTVTLFADAAEAPQPGHRLVVRLVLHGFCGEKKTAFRLLARVMRAEPGERFHCVLASATFLRWRKDREEAPGPRENPAAPAGWHATDARGGVPPLHAWVMQAHLNTQRNASFAGLVEFDGLEKRLASFLRDELTGVGNEAFFFRNIEGEWRRSRAQNLALSCVVVELRHFTTFLKEYDEEAARQLLKTVALLICQNVRVGDSVARVGRSRFYVTLPETAGEEARAIAADLRQEIDHMRVPYDKGRIFRLTAGLGLASLPAPQPAPASVVAFLAEAERSLGEDIARPDKRRHLAPDA